MTQEEIARRVQEYRRKALEHFPLKLIETTGDEALAKWQAEISRSRIPGRAGRR
jgi:hypothetical protein